jgi:hypothetical protein
MIASIRGKGIPAALTGPTEFSVEAAGPAVFDEVRGSARMAFLFALVLCFIVTGISAAAIGKGIASAYFERTDSKMVVIVAGLLMLLALFAILHSFEAGMLCPAPIRDADVACHLRLFR